MKKAVFAREIIKKYIFTPNGTKNNDLHVEPIDNTYMIVSEGDEWKAYLCYGKELKGYIGDIIYLQYDGEKYGTGDFILKSDRHGVICKFKKRTEEK